MRASALGEPDAARQTTSILVAQLEVADDRVETALSARPADVRAQRETAAATDAGSAPSR